MSEPTYLLALIKEAALHLTNWLDKDECECDGPGHWCGRSQVERCRDRLLLAAAQPAEPVKHHLKVSYDDKVDCLYVDCNDSNEPIDAEEDDKGILYRYANSDGRLVGITIMNFMGQSRYGKGTP